MSETKTSLEEDLERIADEVRVRIHLATMEARDAWEKLEPRLREFRTRAHGVTTRIGDELATVGNELRDELTKLRDRIGR